MTYNYDDDAKLAYDRYKAAEKRLDALANAYAEFLRTRADSRFKSALAEVKVRVSGGGGHITVDPIAKADA